MHRIRKDKRAQIRDLEFRGRFVEWEYDEFWMTKIGNCSSLRKIQRSLTIPSLEHDDISLAMAFEHTIQLFVKWIWPLDKWTLVIEFGHEEVPLDLSIIGPLSIPFRMQKKRVLIWYIYNVQRAMNKEELENFYDPDSSSDGEGT